MIPLFFVLSTAAADEGLDFVLAADAPMLLALSPDAEAAAAAWIEGATSEQEAAAIAHKAMGDLPQAEVAGALMRAWELPGFDARSPVIASLGEFRTTGEERRSVQITRLWVPASDPGALIQAAAQGQEATEDQGIVAFSGEAGPMALTAGEDHVLAVAALQGGAFADEAMMVQLLREPTGAVRHTPAVAALVAPDTRIGLLVRHDRLLEWGILSGEQMAIEALAQVNDELQAMMWAAAEGVLDSAWYLPDPSYAETEDTTVRLLGVDLPVLQVVSSFTEHGVAVHDAMDAGKVDLPRWSGEGTSVAEVTLRGDIVGALREAIVPPGAEGMAIEDFKQAAHRGGPAASLAITRSPWGFARWMAEGLTGEEDWRSPVAAPIRGARAVLAFDESGKPVIDVIVVTRGPRAADAVAGELEKAVAGLPEGLGPREVSRPARKLVAVRIGGTESGFDPSDTERLPPGWTTRFDMAAARGVLPATQEIGLNGVFTLQARTEGHAGVLEAGFGDVSDPAALPASPGFLPRGDLIDPAAYACVRDVLESLSVEGYARGDEDLREANIETLLTHADDPISACAAAWPELGDATDRLLGRVEMVRALDALEQRQEAREPLVQACELGQQFACMLLPRLPERFVPTEALARVDAQLRVAAPLGGSVVYEQGAIYVNDEPCEDACGDVDPYTAVYQVPADAPASVIARLPGDGPLAMLVRDGQGRAGTLLLGGCGGELRVRIEGDRMTASAKGAEREIADDDALRAFFAEHPDTAGNGGVIEAAPDVTWQQVARIIAMPEVACWDLEVSSR